MALRRKSEPNSASSAADSPEMPSLLPQRTNPSSWVDPSVSSTGRARSSRTWKRGRILRRSSRHFSDINHAMNRHKAPPSAPPPARGMPQAGMQNAQVNPGTWQVPNMPVGLAPLPGMAPTALLPIAGHPGTSTQSKESAPTHTNAKVR